MITKKIISELLSDNDFMLLLKSESLNMLPSSLINGTTINEE